MRTGDNWSRREIVAAMTAAGVLGCGQEVGETISRATSPQPGPFRTALCDLLGIEYPVLQAPMSRIVTPAMVAAVSNAGGLGILPGIGVTPADLEGAIGEIRRLTDRPFGVNLILHEQLLDPADPGTIEQSTVTAVQEVLNRFRQDLGIDEVSARPGGFPDVIGPALEVILEARVPVFSVGLGRPTESVVGQCHERGMRVVAMASTVEDAIELSLAGVDVIAAQGSDAGGHRSTWTKRSSPEYASIGTFSLVPQVVDAVPQPVVAAGGIMNGRGLLASISLGATGVLVGTRFIATTESAAPDFYKAALIDRSSDDTMVTDAFTGLYARVIRNRFAEAYRMSGAPVLPAGMQQIAATDVVNAAVSRGSEDYYPLYAGQGIGMIRDLPGAADVVAAVIGEARSVLAGLGDRVTA